MKCFIVCVKKFRWEVFRIKSFKCYISICNERLNDAKNNVIVLAIGNANIDKIFWGGVISREIEDIDEICVVGPSSRFGWAGWFFYKNVKLIDYYFLKNFFQILNFVLAKKKMF